VHKRVPLHHDGPAPRERGESSGPVQVDKPWDAFADDQLELMNHLGIRAFLVLGCCIGGPFVLKLMEQAPDCSPQAG
jgi:pimeloyl-ACP methyl ester carboxylesterase